jgi:hypothetical protein
MILRFYLGLFWVGIVTALCAISLNDDYNIRNGLIMFLWTMTVGAIPYAIFRVLIRRARDWHDKKVLEEVIRKNQERNSHG